MGSEAHQRNPDQPRVLRSNDPDGEVGSGAGQATTRDSTSRYCDECLIGALMSSPRVYLRAPKSLNTDPEPCPPSHISTIAPTPNRPPAQEHHYCPLISPSYARSSKGELTCEGHLIGQNDQPYSSSSVFLSSGSTMMNTESESDCDFERPRRILGRWTARSQSRSVSPKSTFIPNRSIPSLTHASRNEGFDVPHGHYKYRRPGEQSNQSSSAFGSWPSHLSTSRSTNDDKALGTI